MAGQTILLVDDEATIRFGIRKFLENKGYSVEEADCCQKAEELFRANSPDVVILDNILPDGTGLDLMLKLKSEDLGTRFIILTGQGSIDLAVQAIKDGAEQFLTKPVKMAALEAILSRLVENERNRQKQLVQESRRTRHLVDPFLGNSTTINQLKEQSSKILAAERPILIHGDTGTGKTTLARWLHYNGPRSQETFVDLNCAGLSKDFLETELFGHGKGAFTGAVSSKIGLLELANHGTLFLDEIGDMDLQVQPKLLKALEEKQFRRLGEVSNRRVDVQLIAATHQNLGLLVRDKKFRSDLYYRISSIPLFIPSLKERVEDIPIIATHLLDSIANALGHNELRLTEDAEDALKAYSWPGNIRELRNVLDRAAILSESKILDRKDLLIESTHTANGFAPEEDVTLEELERNYLERIFRQEEGSVERTAKRLKVPRSSLYYKLKKHGIYLSK